MRIVLDTNVLIRGNPKASGPAREALLAIVSGEHALIISRPLLQELERTLTYTRVQNLWQLTAGEIDEYIGLVASVGELVPTLSGDSIITKDPDDDAVVYAALIGRANVICTLDAHFFEPDVLTLCDRYGIRVMTDIELLQLIREATDH